MKQPVRISEFTDAKQGYGFLVIDILVPAGTGSDSLQPAGHIKFQRTLTDDYLKEEHPWYGMSFNCSTDKVQHLEKMAAVASLAKSKCEYNAQPEDVLKAIEADEHKVFYHEFYPVSSEGKYLYDIGFLGSVYTRIVAEDDDQAREVMKQKELNKHDLGERREIKFS